MTTPDADRLPLATPCGTCDHTRNWHNIDGCTVTACGCGLFAAPTADQIPAPMDPVHILGTGAEPAPQQARRDTVRYILDRLDRGLTLSENERLALRNRITAEQADADQAREQLAADPLRRMLNSPVARVAALGAAAHEHAARMVREANERAEQAQQTARDARQGEAEAVRAREAAERRATESRTYAERADREGERLAELLGQAEARVRAVERSAADARIRSGHSIAEARRNRDAWRNARKRAREASADYAGIVARRAEAEASRDRWKAAAFEQQERASAAEQRAERAEATLTAVRAIKKAPGRSPDNRYANAQDDGWDQAIDAVRAALGDPQPATQPEPSPALPLATCDRYGTLIAHATHLFMRGCRAYRCPGLTVTDLRTPAAGSTTIFTLPGRTEPGQAAEPLRRGTLTEPQVHVHLDNRGALYHPWPQEWRTRHAEGGKSEYRRNVEREAEQRVTVYGISVNEWDRLWLTVQAIADAAGVKPE